MSTAVITDKQERLQAGLWNRITRTLELKASRGQIPLAEGGEIVFLIPKRLMLAMLDPIISDLRIAEWVVTTRSHKDGQLRLVLS